MNIVLIKNKLLIIFFATVFFQAALAADLSPHQLIQNTALMGAMDMSDMNMQEMDNDSIDPSMNMSNMDMSEHDLHNRTLHKHSLHKDSINPSLSAIPVAPSVIQDMPNPPISEREQELHTMGKHKMVSPALFAFWGKHIEPKFTQFNRYSDQHHGNNERMHNIETRLWYGNDTHKLLVKSTLEAVTSSQWDMSNDVLYDRAWLPFWDIQVGMRFDTSKAINETTQSLQWLALGIEGTLPYDIETETTTYLNRYGDIVVNTSFEKDFYISQQWILQPSLDVLFNRRTTALRQQKAGVADYNAALRLYYQVNPQVLPYIAVIKQHDYAANQKSTAYKLGLSFWF